MPLTCCSTRNAHTKAWKSPSGWSKSTRATRRCNHRLPLPTSGHTAAPASSWQTPPALSKQQLGMNSRTDTWHGHQCTPNITENGSQNGFVSGAILRCHTITLCYKTSRTNQHAPNTGHEHCMSTCAAAPEVGPATALMHNANRS